MEKKKILNDVEQKVWEAILSYMAQYNVPPMRTELSELLSNKSRMYSPQLLQYYLQSMQEKGWIMLEPRKKRGIKIV